MIIRLLAAATLIAAIKPAAVPAADESRPNILFAFADDWGKYASAYREIDGDKSPNAVVNTPHFDRIAQDGVLFTHAYVTAPSCTPCRSSLLSGQYFFRTGRGAILQGAIWDSSIPTYPLLLQAKGYHIGHTYKVWSPGTPANAPYGAQATAFNKAGTQFNRFSQYVSGAGDIETAKQHLLAEVRGNFQQFLGQRDKDAPFCYWFGPTNCHRKWTRGSGREIWGLNPDDLKGCMPPFLPDTHVVREDFCDYLGEVQAFDAGLGVLLDELERIGELDNTLIVVSGDHGIPGFPRGKCNLYDFGVHVALAVRWGSRITGGRVVNDFVNLMDLAPTFLEAGGETPPDVMTGRSLMPILAGKQQGQVDPTRDAVVVGRERHVALAREGRLPYPQRSIHTHDYIYIRNFAPERWPMGDGPGYGTPAAEMPPFNVLENNTFAAFGDLDASPTKAWVIEHRDDAGMDRMFDFAFGRRPEEELYDLKSDPHQMKNLAGDPAFREIQQQLSERLLRTLRDAGDPRVTGDGTTFDKPPFTDAPAARRNRRSRQAKHPTQTGRPKRLLVGDYQKKLIALVNERNEVEWQHEIAQIHDAHLLDNGNILFQTNFRNVIEMTPKGKTVWKYEAPAAKRGAKDRVEIHAFQRLPNGRTMIAESGRGRIVEVDSEGNVVHEIRLKLDNPNPHRDTRLVRKLDNGNYLVAHEGDLAVREYNADGRVVWEHAVGTRLYSATRLKNGNTLIGAGDGHRVAEINRDGETVWSVEEKELPGITLHWITMVDRLPNGNTLIVNCHAGPENPQMIEVTPEKKVVWTFKDFDRFGNSLPVGRVVAPAKKKTRNVSASLNGRVTQTHTVSVKDATIPGVRSVEYFGYDDCIELRNKSTRVVLCPAAGGRVLEYSLNGVNSLYLDDRERGFEYKPGKRAPMTAGRFDIGPEQVIPRHPLLWFGRWTAEVTGPRAAKLVSQDDPETGTRLTREFRLDAESSRLSCTQTIQNVSDRTTEWCHWCRTFAVGNGICVIPLTAGSRFPNNYVMYSDGSNINIRPEDPHIRVREGFLEIVDVPKFPKLGFDSYAGWFAYLAPNDLMFVKRYRTYPDRVYNEVAGLTLSIWYPEDRRVELEPIGPRERLQPAESASFTEDWWLLPRKFPTDRHVDLKGVEAQVVEHTVAPE